MLSSQLFWRVFAVYVLLTSASALAFVWLMSARHRDTVYDQVRQRLADVGAVILPDISDDLARQLTPPHDRGVTLRSADNSEDSPESVKSPTPSEATTSAAPPTIAASRDATLPDNVMADATAPDNVATDRGPPPQPAESAASPVLEASTVPAPAMKGVPNTTGTSLTVSLSDATAKLIRRRLQSTHVAAELLDIEGHRVWVSDERIPDSGDVTPEIGLAADGGTGYHVHNAAGTQVASLHYAVVVGSPRGPVGYLRLWLPLDQLQAQLSALDLRVWAVAAMIAAIALLITYLMVGRIINPLESLTAAAERLAAGESPGRVHVTSTSRNEIGTLAAAFNLMSSQLSARIGDLQLQQRQLEANNEQLNTVLSAMVEGVLAVDESDRLLMANPAGCRLLDLNPGSVVGRPIWEAVRHPRVQEVLRHTLETGEQSRLEFDVPWTQSRVAAVASRLSRPTGRGAVIVLHDVTELRRLENLRREFVSNVSHELKTPLTSISAYTETLLSGALEDPTHNRTFLHRIEEQAERLQNLILDLLELARLEADDHHIELVPTPVDEVMFESVDDHLEVARSKQITLSAMPPAEPLLIEGDAESLRTIIDNLVANAINYTPALGRVQVRWYAEEEWVVIEVSDTGVGIAKEHQARIFERFYRVDRARSRELGGTGLGLSIVKHLCQMFGGSIRVVSQVGAGSTFAVRLKKSSDDLGNTSAAVMGEAIGANLDSRRA